jgi:hypothetical protein
MNYYYFAATLPALDLDQPPPFSVGEFRERCSEHLAADDLAALDELEGPLGAESRRAFVRAWRNRERVLRTAVARHRAARLKRDETPSLHPEGASDSAVERAAAEAFSKASPLEREHALDRFRWSQIEQAAGLSPFTAEAVLSYALRLRLVERWAKMEPESGLRRVDTLVARPPEDRENSDADHATDEQDDSRRGPERRAI